MHHSRVRANSNRVVRRAVRCRVQFVAGIILLLPPHLANAQESDRGVDTTQPTRPTILPSRWEEDWSVLADPRVARQPFDNLKYIPLSPNDPKTYLSLGADLRQRFEANDRAGFGVFPNRNNDYLISRRPPYCWPSPDVHTVRERLRSMEDHADTARSGCSRSRAGFCDSD